MHSFLKITTAALLVLASNAFPVVPPSQEVRTVSSPIVQQNGQLTRVTTSTTNLPSHKELASLATSSTTALSAATAAPVVTPNSAVKLASPGITIANIKYDGKVPKTEADEYVVITNESKSSVDISGYYVYVATTGTQGPTFNFPKASVLKPATSIRIYTNEIHKETGGYSYGSGKAIWNNRGGVAVLKDSNGKKLGELKYKANVS